MQSLNLVKNSPQPPSRGGAAFLQYDAGKYLLLGGANRNEELNDIWILHVSLSSTQQLNGLWSKLELQNQDLYTPRSGQQAFVDKNGIVYVFGGQKFETGQQTDEFFRIDIPNKIMNIVVSKNKPKARNSHTFTYDMETNLAYLYGGADQTGPLGDLQIFDLSSNEWKEEILVGDCIQPREMHTAHLISSKQDFIINNDSNQKKLLKSDNYNVVELDFQLEGDDLTAKITKVNIGQEDMQIAEPEPEEQKQPIQLSAHQTKYLVSLGGRFITDLLQDILLINLESFECFTFAKSMAQPLCAHTSSLVGENKIVVFGGCNQLGFTSEIWMYDLEKVMSEKKNLTSQQNSPEFCARIAMSSLYSSQFECIFVFGGSSVEEESNQIIIVSDKLI